MIRIAVVDDDREELQELCELLQFTSLELQEALYHRDFLFWQ